MNDLTPAERAAFDAEAAAHIGSYYAAEMEGDVGTCPAPCPYACKSCTRDRDCECYDHAYLAAGDPSE